jgi:hypothetical protein
MLLSLDEINNNEEQFTILKQILKIKLPIPEAGEDKATYNLQKNFDF